MIGLGTLINTGAIIVGGIIGHFFGKLLKERYLETLNVTCGVAVLIIGIAGALEGMLKIVDGNVSATRSMFVVVVLLIGALIGELINIDGHFEHFGEWLKIKSGNAKDKNFVNAFVTASFTVCIGAMAVIGAINDGISGDYTILAVKSVLDLIIILVMTCTLGKGAAFSAIPVLIFEGVITLLARVIQPIMTDASMGNLSLIGSILIFCVGLNLVWGPKVRVANLLPALVIAVAAAFLPI